MFHQFSGIASTLAHAASPVVPGLFVVAMALKELDNIIQKNQVADVSTNSLQLWSLQQVAPLSMLCKALLNTVDSDVKKCPQHC